jgi:hypothetical protein
LKSEPIVFSLSSSARLCPNTDYFFIFIIKDIENTVTRNFSRRPIAVYSLIKHNLNARDLVKSQLSFTTAIKTNAKPYVGQTCY